MNEVRVAVIHGKHLVREGIAHILREGNITVVASVDNLQTLLALPIGLKEIDVFIVSAAHNGKPLADIVASIRKNSPDGKIIFLSDSRGTDEQLAEAYAAGAVAFVTTDTPAAALIEHVRLGALGVRVFPAPLSQMAESGRSRIEFGGHVRRNFSQREQDILRCLAAGESNKCIARSLSITESTVKAHVRSILRKLGAANRTQAAIWATAAASDSPRLSD